MPIDPMTSNPRLDGEALIRQFESTHQSLPHQSASASFFLKIDDAFLAQAEPIVGIDIDALEEKARRADHVLVKCLKPDHGEAICTTETKGQILRWRTVDQDRPLRSDPLEITLKKLQRDIGETQ